MNFGDLFFLFIFLAIILFNLVKKMKERAGPRPEEGEKPKSSWKILLEEALKQMEQQKASNGAAPGTPPVFSKTGWDQILQKEPTETMQGVESLKPVMEAEPRPVEKGEGLEPLYAAEALSENEEKPGLKEKIRIRAFAEEPAAEEKTLESVSLRDLRQAVIWSEILSPPLGIRGLEGWER